MVHPTSAIEENHRMREMSAIFLCEGLKSPLSGDGLRKDLRKLGANHSDMRKNKQAIAGRAK